MGYIFWLVVILIVIFLLWIFLGGGDYRYQGLNLPKSDPETPVEEDPVYEETRIEEPIVEQVKVEINNTPPVPVFIPSEPDKTKSTGERICCHTLEKIYHKPFKTIRPDFLRNPETGRNMELDCYNEELKIAVEYNGIQHYVWPNFTRQTKEDFLKQVKRDELKVQLCDQHGVYLIRVPYNVPKNMIPEYIKYYLPENVQRMTRENSQTIYKI